MPHVHHRVRLWLTRPTVLTHCLHMLQIVCIGFGKPSMPPAGWDAMKTFVEGLGVSDLSEVCILAVPCRHATTDSRLH